MIKFFLNILIFLFFLSIKSHANVIAIVDINYIIKNSEAGKSIQQILEKDNNKFKSELKKKNESLKNEEKKIISQKNVLSEQEFNNKIQEFRDKLKKHNSEKNKNLELLNQKKALGISKLLENLNQILVDYSKENNFDLVVDKKYTILTKNDNDITSKVLELLNNKIKKIKLN